MLYSRATRMAVRGDPGQGSDDIRDVKRYQRGLLKDKPKHNTIKLKFFFLFASIKECNIMVKNLINIKNVAIVAVFSLVAFFGFNSFTAVQSAKKADPSDRYYFLPYSDNAGLIENPESWSDENENEESCAGATYLCSITYDTDLYDSIEEFLEENPTKTDIENNAVTVDYKNNP